MVSMVIWGGGSENGLDPQVTMVVSLLSHGRMTCMIWGHPHDLGSLHIMQYIYLSWISVNSKMRVVFGTRHTPKKQFEVVISLKHHRTDGLVTGFVLSVTGMESSENCLLPGNTAECLLSNVWSQWHVFFNILIYTYIPGACNIMLVENNRNTSSTENNNHKTRKTFWWDVFSCCQNSHGKSSFEKWRHIVVFKACVWWLFKALCPIQHGCNYCIGPFVDMVYTIYIYIYIYSYIYSIYIYTYSIYIYSYIIPVYFIILCVYIDIYIYMYLQIDR